MPKRDVRLEGFTELLPERAARDEQPGDERPRNEQPLADVVFVHGLGGNPQTTWTFGKIKDDKPVLWPFKKDEEDKSVYWPRQLLSKDFVNFRILTYGYDSHIWNSRANDRGIRDHGRALLHALDIERQKDRTRPIIFLVHSLGGLVLKQMLILSKYSSGSGEYLKDVYKSTFATVFFGTPHRGSSYANLGEVARKMYSGLLPWIVTNKKLLRDLSPNSDLATMLRDEFGAMLMSKDFETFSFQEAKADKRVRDKIVTDDSSSLDIDASHRDFINADHSGMCRFRGADDEGYRKVKGVLLRYRAQLEEKQAQEQQQLNAEEEARLSECLNSLDYPKDIDGYEMIRDAESSTFEWIWSESKPGFVEWLKGNGGLFWIQGIPGSGKSTLLKHLYDSEKTLEILKFRWKSFAVGKYFFREQATSSNRKSYTGLLQSLLYRVLRYVPALYRYVRKVHHWTQMGDGWTQSQLEKALCALANQIDIEGCICLFVDALDEYPGECTDLARKLNRFLDRTVDGSFHIKLCVSSRPVGDFKAMFHHVPGFEIQAWTKPDIQALVNKRLREANRGDMPLLSEEITEKAKGVFLWVNIILKNLWIRQLDYESEESLLSRLYEFPTDLQEIYEHLMHQIPKAMLPRIRIILTLMCCNANRDRPLSLAEMCLAIDLPESEDVPFELGLQPQDDVRRCKQMLDRLNIYLGAFVEVAPSQTYGWKPPPAVYAPLSLEEYELTTSNIQFSHRTAKDFILESMETSPQTSIHGETPLQEGHRRLCRLYTYLAAVQSGLYYMLPIASVAENEFEFNVYETDLVICFGLHARELEYQDYIRLNGRTGNSHDIRELKTHADYWESRRQPYPQTTKDCIQHMPNAERLAMVNSFHKAMTLAGGEDWFRDWAEYNLFEFKLPDLPSFLAFAVLNGLFFYAMDILETQSVSQVDQNDPPLIFWSLAACQFIQDKGVLDLFRDESQRSNYFTNYLLSQERFNPNVTFTIPFEQTKPPLCPLPPSIQEKSGVAQITLLHACLGTIITSGFPTEISLAALETMCLLLEAGAAPGDAQYENYWQLRDEPKQRSIIHYLTFPVNYKNRFKDNTVKDFTPFTLPDAGPMLCRTIKLLLEHGADPNAVDSAGTHVLTSIIKSPCPDDVVECALTAGAKVPLQVLSEEGTLPPGRAILLETRWLKRKFYMPEAWEKIKRAGIVEDMSDEEDDGRVSTEEKEAGEIEEQVQNVGLNLSSLLSWTSFLRNSLISG